MKRVMVIYGTRPEAVKMAPLIKALELSPVLDPVVVSTGQHREMMQQVNAWFDIEPQHDLNVFRQGSTLNELAARIFTNLTPILEEERPDAVVVQGDTTTVAIAAIAAFYRLTPLVHLEAGLRSGNLHSPFPEEANRRLTGQLTALHLAPTDTARANLIREGVPPQSVVVTGNTVIDALLWTIDKPVTFSHPRLAEGHAANQPMVLLTAHRRENWGEPMRRVGEGVATLARRYPDHLFVYPAHQNPSVRAQIESTLQDLPNAVVCDSMDYPEFVHAMQWARLLLTDSGGVQEEAPSFGKPVLVLRDTTERPEAVAAGTVKLIGTMSDRIVAEASQLLDDATAYARMARATNPYGDGAAAERGCAAISALLGVGERVADFTTRS